MEETVVFRLGHACRHEGGERVFWHAFAGSWVPFNPCWLPLLGSADVVVLVLVLSLGFSSCKIQGYHGNSMPLWVQAAVRGDQGIGLLFCSIYFYSELQYAESKVVEGG